MYLDKRIVTIFLSLSFFLCVLAGSPVSATKIDNFSITNGSPGVEASISVNISDSSQLSIKNISDNLSVSSHTNDGGIFTTDDPDNDGNNESIGWFWINIGSYNPSVIFDIDSNATVGDKYTIDLISKNQSVNSSKKATFTVKQGNGDKGDNDRKNDGDNSNSKSLRVSATNATPGGSTTINISADNSGGLTIENIPIGWGVIDSKNDGGFFLTNDQDNDGHKESVGWGWPSQGFHNPAVNLSIPEDAQAKSYNLKVKVSNGNTVSKDFTVNVFKSTGYDLNNDGEISGDEVRKAILCFLFGTNCIGDQLTGEEVRQIIKKFLFGI